MLALRVGGSYACYTVQHLESNTRIILQNYFYLVQLGQRMLRALNPHLALPLARLAADGIRRAIGPSASCRGRRRSTAAQGIMAALRLLLSPAPTPFTQGLCARDGSR
jgi:hypothetical protein